MRGQSLARIIVAVLVLAISITACSARDNSARKPIIGQTPQGGPVGGAPLTYSDECRQGDALVRCAQIAAVARETVEVLSSGQRVGQPTVEMNSGRAVYEAELPWTGPIDAARDRLRSLLELNGWTPKGTQGLIDEFVGRTSSPYAGHLLYAEYPDKPSSNDDLLVRVTLTGPKSG